jgi:hypothetical protein
LTCCEKSSGVVFDDLKLSFKAFAGIYSTVRAGDPVYVFVYRYPKYSVYI